MRACVEVQLVGGWGGGVDGDARIGAIPATSSHTHTSPSSSIDLAWIICQLVSRARRRQKDRLTGDGGEVGRRVSGCVRNYPADVNPPAAYHPVPYL